MIARVWHGRSRWRKPMRMTKYLTESDRGIRDYQKVPGNRGVTLMRRTQGDPVHFLLISFWDSRDAITGYAGDDIDAAQYFSFDRECLVDPEPNVLHYEVMTVKES